MDRLSRAFRGRRASEAAYEPIKDDDGIDGSGSSSITQDTTLPARFSWVEYGIFVLLGVSMLWAW